MPSWAIASLELVVCVSGSVPINCPFAGPGEAQGSVLELVILFDGIDDGALSPISGRY